MSQMTKGAVTQLKEQVTAWQAETKTAIDDLQSKYDAAFAKFKAGKANQPNPAALERQKQMMHHLEELVVRAQQLEAAHDFSDGSQDGA